MTTRPHVNNARPLTAPMQVFDLNHSAAEMWGEVAGAEGHNAITLRKSINLRVVLLTMHAGSSLHEHKAFGPIMLQVISGHVRFTPTDAVTQEVDLRPQMVVMLDAGIPHGVQAVDDSVCLLTMGGTASDR